MTMRCGVPRIGITASTLLALVTWSTSAGWCEDIVRTKNGATYRGMLLRWDERQIHLRLPNKKTPKKFATDEVAEVVAPLEPHHEAAENALSKGQFAEAAGSYKLALDQENRDWARSRIRAGLVKAFLGAGQWTNAAIVFGQLAEGRADAELMTLAPLLWIPGEKVPERALKTAQRWLGSREPMERLLAGSWLLETEHQAKAMAVLERLQTLTDQRIRWLARAQAWRVHAIDAKEEEIVRFRSLIDKMPPAVRGGPQYLLGLAYERAGNPEEAALAYLWAPFVYAAPSNVRADATWRAAQACEQLGFADDAGKLYREIVERYPATRWSEAADEKLAHP